LGVWSWRFGKDRPEDREGKFAHDILANIMDALQYGIYDRPELESWFKGRIVLLGDAAHPSSPVRNVMIDFYDATIVFSIWDKVPTKPSKTSTISCGS